MTLFACTSVTASATNYLIAYANAKFIAALFLMSLCRRYIVGRRNGTVAIRLLFGMFVLHPAWTVSAINGDCGIMMRDWSWAVSALGCIAYASQLTWFAPLTPHLRHR